MTVTGLSQFDTRVYSLAVRYQKLWCQRTGAAQWQQRDPRGGKNWKSFIKAEKLRCRLAADLGEFLESQFAMLATWKDCPAPYPAMLSSKGAEKRYHDWKARQKKDSPVRKYHREGERMDAQIEATERLIRDLIKNRNDVSSVEDVLKHPMLLAQLPKAYLLQSKQFIALRDAGWYKTNLGIDIQ